MKPGHLDLVRRGTLAMAALPLGLAASACLLDLPDPGEHQRFSCASDDECLDGNHCVEKYCQRCDVGRGGDDCHVIWSESTTFGAGRYGHAMVYDPVREVVVSFGGLDENGAVTDEVHEWNGLVWTLRCGATTACSGPSAREGHAMAYLPGTGVVMMGGRAGGGAMQSDTWVWNGTSWTGLCNTGGALCSPDPQTTRADHSMAYLPEASTLYLFGGHYARGTSSGRSAITFAWNTGTSAWDVVCNPFSTTTPCASPFARFGQAMTYDSASHSLIMAGGWDSDAKDTFMNDTWSWDGSAWTLLCARSGAPCNFTLPRAQLAFADDTDRDRLIMFGGIYPAAAGLDPMANITREWSGSIWSEATCGAGTECLGPRPRAQHAMAYDAARGQVVLMGGRATRDCGSRSPICTDTWIYHGP